MDELWNKIILYGSTKLEKGVPLLRDCVSLGADNKRTGLQSNVLIFE